MYVRDTCFINGILFKQGELLKEANPYLMQLTPWTLVLRSLNTLFSMAFSCSMHTSTSICMLHASFFVAIGAPTLASAGIGSIFKISGKSDVRLQKWPNVNDADALAHVHWSLFYGLIHEIPSITICTLVQKDPHV